MGLGLETSSNNPYGLYPHQQDALEKMFNGCILYGGVGSGKSRTAAAYYMKMEADADVYVITTARKRDSLDWEGEFVRFNIGKHLNASVAGTLTVDSWNNLGKYRDVVGAFFIFDEQRVVGSGEWAKHFLAIARRNRWILLSATPGDTWLDYIPVFLAHGWYRNRTEFKREHVVYASWSKFPKVERFQNVGKLVRQRNQLLVHMPYSRSTRRHIRIVPTDYDKGEFKRVDEDRWHIYESRPLKDVAELFRVLRRLVASDATRMRAAKTLMEDKNRIIVFYNFDYELTALRNLLQEMNVPNVETVSDPTDWVYAEWNGKKHQEVPTTKRWIYLVQYVAGAEAWNCTTTNSMMFYSLTYSYKNFEQALGRIDRLDTPFTDLDYYVLKSKSWIDEVVWKSLRSKKNFNEQNFAKTQKVNGRHIGVKADITQ